MDKVNKPVVDYSQKTFAIYKSNKSLIQKYKEHFPIHNENTANQNKEKKLGKGCEQAFHKRDDSKKGHCDQDNNLYL